LRQPTSHICSTAHQAVKTTIVQLLPPLYLSARSNSWSVGSPTATVAASAASSAACTNCSAACCSLLLAPFLVALLEEAATVAAMASASARAAAKLALLMRSRSRSSRESPVRADRTRQVTQPSLPSLSHVAWTTASAPGYHCCWVCTEHVSSMPCAQQVLSPLLVVSLRQSPYTAWSPRARPSSAPEKQGPPLPAELPPAAAGTTSSRARCWHCCLMPAPCCCQLLVLQIQQQPRQTRPGPAAPAAGSRAEG